jgi:hypothetical protein
MYLQKIVSKKNFEKQLIFFGILSANDEKIRIRDPDPNQDPQDSGTDPRVLIRANMTRIHGHGHCQIPIKLAINFLKG